MLYFVMHNQGVDDYSFVYQWTHCLISQIQINTNVST